MQEPTTFPGGLFYNDAKRQTMVCMEQAPPISLEDWILGVVERRLADMEKRLAERDADIARLRREMDALREGLQFGIDTADTIREVGKNLAYEIVKAGDTVAPRPVEPHACECGDCDQK